MCNLLSVLQMSSCFEHHELNLIPARADATAYLLEYCTSRRSSSQAPPIICLATSIERVQPDLTDLVIRTYPATSRVAYFLPTSSTPVSFHQLHPLLYLLPCSPSSPHPLCSLLCERCPRYQPAPTSSSLRTEMAPDISGL